MSRGRTWTALALAVLVGIGVVGFEELVPSPAAPTAPAVPEPVAEPVAGSYVCAAGSGAEGTDLQLIAARPGSAGPAPAAVEALAVEDGGVSSTSLPPVFPNTDGRARISAGEDAATIVRWSAGPVAVERQWELTDADELAAGTVSGPCARPSARTWMVPGMSTVGGEEARLRIANPSRSDATVAVGFRTPQGAEEPIALRNLTVEARDVLEIVVNDYLPEQVDLGAVVEVASGRVAVEGYQLARAGVGGIESASLLAATVEPAESWTVPWVTDGEERVSWLWVLNPSDRTAAIEVTLHTAEGGRVPDGLAEVTVPPGELRRVDLRGTFPPDTGVAAVTASSNGVPVAVSGGVRIGGDDPSTTALAVQLGAPSPSSTWTLSGDATGGRAQQLRIVNPAGVAATYSVAIFDGVTVLRPDELQDVAVGPGAVSVVDVVDHLGGAGAWSAFVTTSSGEVVAGRLGNGGEDAWHLVATLGTPARAWAAPFDALANQHRPGLVRRLGTDLGISVDAPIASSPSPAGDGSADPEGEDSE